MIILVAFVLWVSVIFVDVPFSVRRLSPPGLPILDMRFGYTKADVELVLGSLGIAGRQEYARFLTFFDFLFPLCYGISLSLIVRKLSYSYRSSMRFISLLAALPLLAAACDATENVFFLSFLSNITGISAFAVAISSMFTMGKWIFLLSSILTIIILSSLALIGKRREPHG